MDREQRVIAFLIFSGLALIASCILSIRFTIQLMLSKHYLFSALSDLFESLALFFAAIWVLTIFVSMAFGVAATIRSDLNGRRSKNKS